MTEPLPIGTLFDDLMILDVVDRDPTDPYQPYLYLLEDGRQVWIPVTEKCRHDFLQNAEPWRLPEQSNLS